MTTFKTALAAVALAFALSTGAAVAQTATGTATPPKPATAAPATTTTAPTAKIGTPKTPESAACSKEADAKNLHGKERKKFRASCIKAAKAAPKKM
jgi:hypothetical protein